MTILLDLAVVAVLALFAWRGWAKGFVLTLCGLLAVIVAFVGASWASEQFSQPLSDLVQPYVQSHLEELLEGVLADPSGTEDPSASQPIFSIPGVAEDDPGGELQATLNQLLEAVAQSEFFGRLTDTVAAAIEDGTLTVVTTAAAAVASFLSLQLARVVLFFFSFVLILVACWLVSHLLDLAFRLPVLRTLNEAGGLALGLAKGLVILLVACWGLTAFNVVPPETAEQTLLFSLFLNFQII